MLSSFLHKDLLTQHLLIKNISANKTIKWQKSECGNCLWLKDFCCSTIHHTPPGARGVFLSDQRREDLQSPRSILKRFGHTVVASPPLHFYLSCTLLVSKQWICTPRLPQCLSSTPNSSGCRSQPAFPGSGFNSMNSFSCLPQSKRQPRVFSVGIRKPRAPLGSSKPASAGASWKSTLGSVAV